MPQFAVLDPLILELERLTFLLIRSLLLSPCEFLIFRYVVTSIPQTNDTASIPDERRRSAVGVTRQSRKPRSTRRTSEP